MDAAHAARALTGDDNGMDIREISVDGWRKIIHARDAGSGLDALIAVHDATLGPGCGGCRVFPYASFDDALTDVKNLSRGMTFKNALAGMPFGGGKAVIIANPRTDKTPEMFHAFGHALNSLEGLYFTAEDSGMAEADLLAVLEVSPYAAGVVRDGKGGNPAPFTARGVWRGMQAAARVKTGAESLKDMRVSILGVGAVGMALAALLHEEGAHLTVADVNEDALKEAQSQFGATLVRPEEAVAADVDIFSPCALGGSINAQTLPALKAEIVAGAANNQLATPDMDAALKESNILYAPDFAINAAGVISVDLEILGQWSADEMTRRCDAIGDTIEEICVRAARENRPTGAVADEMALEIIARGAVAAE